MRGNITASDGTVLAYSEKVYNLILDVKSVTSEDGKYLNNTIDALVKCFGLDKDNIFSHSFPQTIHHIYCCSSVP